VTVVNDKNLPGLRRSFTDTADVVLDDKQCGVLLGGDVVVVTPLGVATTPTASSSESTAFPLLIGI